MLSVCTYELQVIKIKSFLLQTMAIITATIAAYVKYIILGGTYIYYTRVLKYLIVINKKIIVSYEFESAICYDLNMTSSVLKNGSLFN